MHHETQQCDDSNASRMMIRAPTFPRRMFTVGDKSVVVREVQYHLLGYGHTVWEVRPARPQHPTSSNLARSRLISSNLVRSAGNDERIQQFPECRPRRNPPFPCHPPTPTPMPIPTKPPYPPPSTHQPTPTLIPSPTNPPTHTHNKTHARAPAPARTAPRRQASIAFAGWAAANSHLFTGRVRGAGR